MSYNGWSNYETWQAALWLGEADIHYTDAEALEEFVNLWIGSDDAQGLLGDILMTWIREVDFGEIAEANKEG